jgi:hypothetical protein
MRGNAGDRLVQGMLDRRRQHADNRRCRDAADGHGDDGGGRGNLGRQGGEPYRPPPVPARGSGPGGIDPELGQRGGLLGQLGTRGPGLQGGQHVQRRAQLGRGILSPGQQRSQGLVRKRGLVPAG